MRRLRTRRGIAIAVVLIIILIIMVLVVAVGTLGIQNLNNMSRDAYNKEAAYAAEAGLSDSLSQLKTSSSWSAGLTNVALPTNTGDKYTVTVTNNFSGGSSVTASDGTTVGPGYVYLRSTGTTATNVQKTVTSMAYIQSVFNMAVFGDQSVTFNGNDGTDGWDSTTGPYVAPSSPQKNAPIGTNGTVAAVVNLTGNVFIDGNVQVGPGAIVSTAVDLTGGSSYSGTASAAAAPQPMPQMTPPISGTGSDVSPASHSTTNLAPGVYDNLTAAGGATINLSAGTYYFKGNVSLNGGAAINVTSGPVIIYIDGAWDTGGGTLTNASGLPKDLQIYGTDSCTSVKVHGNAQGDFVVYARKADITIVGTSDVYGSLSGKTITDSGGAMVHYDTSLNTLTTAGYWKLSGEHRL